MNLIYTSHIGCRLKNFSGCLLFVALMLFAGKSSAVCPGTVTATAATNITCSSFQANWNTPTGAVTAYILDVSTVGDFSSHVSGYPDTIQSTSTSYPVTGLSSSILYYYRVMAVDTPSCRTGSGTWSGVQFVNTLAQSDTCTCTPVNDLVCATDFISNVTIHTLNNTSGCSTGGYSYYPRVGSFTTILDIDSSYTLTISTGGTSSSVLSGGVWFDFNHNSSIANPTIDPGEFFSLGLIPNGSTGSAVITVPPGASPGPTTMRVRYGLNSGSPLAQANGCIMPNNTDGETEDYNVCIYNAINILTPPQNTISCLGYIPALCVVATGSISNYQWYSSSSTSNTGGTAIAGATNACYTPDTSYTNHTGTYFFYCVLESICGTYITTPSSAAASLQINGVPTLGGITVPNPVLCKGNPLTLVGTGAVGAGTGTYVWSGPNGYSSTISPSDTVVFIPGSTLFSGTYSLIVTFPGAGCASNLVTSPPVTVNDSPTVANITATPSPLCATGTLTLCAGATTGAGGISSYIWSGPNGYTATSTASCVTLTPGSLAASGKYALTVTSPGFGCVSTTDTSNVVLVDTVAAAVTGTNVICFGGTTTFHNTTSAGTGTGWSSSNTGVATIDAGLGVVTTTGSAGGTTTITYSVTNSCSTTFATTTLTVNPLPSPITGNTPFCNGLGVCLTDATSGGTWSASNGNITFGSSSGCVTGVSAGTSVITYTLPTSCFVTTIATINPLPTAILGNKNVCVGLNTNLSDGTAGGTWSSSNTAVGTIGTNGIVTGILAGTTTITYTLPTSCLITTTVTVNPLPLGITGTTIVCATQTTSLTDASAGGTWGSSNAGIASVGTDGTVTGVANAGGTATITYTLPTGCIATTLVSVNPFSLISGSRSVCFGLTTPLTDATPGGTWSSSNTNALIGSTGIVTGNTLGTSTITYSIASTGCTTTTTETVNPLPAAISGNTGPICASSTTCFTDASGGGTWSSSNTAVATVVGSSGCVTGTITVTVASNATITYTLPTGCINTTIVTINPIPVAITGVAKACSGLSSCLTDATPGGTWSTSNTAIGTIGTTGCVTTIAASGTMTITYTIPNTCIATTVYTVNPLPTAILGPNAVCSGSTITLSDAGSGTWTSGDATVTVGLNTGTVFGVAAGPATATITYTLPTSCITTTVITINPVPVAITGAAFNVCAGLTIALTDADGTGTWSSINTTVGSIGSTTGIVTGIVAGTTTISYTISTGCAATQVVTVNPLPLPISGNLGLCLGLTTSLTDASGGGGTWSSSNTAVATIGSTSGLITAAGLGTAIITYTLPTGCITTSTVTVNGNPASITFITPNSVCPGFTISLTDATTGGTWSSSNTGVATVIGSTGVVTGISGGTSTITYTLGTGCTVTTVVTINPVPSAITGSTNICLGSTSALTDAGGGTWTSSNTAVGTIGSTSGLVTGITLGTTAITYTLPVTGCLTSITLTVVNSVSAITGTTNVCSGLTTTLSDAITGGIWSSSNAAVASVVGSTGVVTGVATTFSTATITYTLGGCITTTPVTVNPLPAVITGTTNVCVGLTTHLSDVTAGGTWSSSDATIGSIGTSGIVTGIAQGTVTITYTLGTGCINTTVVTVNPLPSAITGGNLVCSGATIALSDAGGGTWSSSNAAYGTIGSASGILTGTGNGNVTITYTLPTGCITTTTVNVITSIPGITGIATSCPLIGITLSDAQAGGTWSTTSGIVTVDGSGNVSDISPGTATISYSLGGVCTVTKVVTFNNVPAITGTTNICYASPSTLHDATPGGTWSSTNTSVATIGTGGVVTPVTTGTTIISYILPSGCYTTTTVTIVNTLPNITGTLTVCVSAATNLTDAITGGTWSSSNGNSTVGTSGIVTGNTSGTSTISYKLGTGCLTTSVVTVNPVPLPISGPGSLCQNTSLSLTSIVLSDVTAGGTWSSASLTIVAVANVATVTATGTGLSEVNYILPTGCSSPIKIITVNTTPASITGPSSVCFLSGVIESDASGSGTWSSSNTSVVFVSAGATFGVSVGTANITFTAPTGCSVDRTITVNPLPGSISGTTTLCVAGTSLLSDAPGGGTWSSDNASVASINSATGLLRGVSAGTAHITYTTTSGCTTTTVATILETPTPILGTPIVCLGGSTILSDTTGTGTWSSSDVTTAAIGSDGTVTGANVGTATITYSIATGCSNTVVFTVNPFPAAITGTTSVCPGLTTSLSNATTGGTWSSSNPAIATIGSGTGTVTGISPGSATITYTSAAGCSVTTTVNVFGNVGAITSSSSVVCIGLTITLADTTAGGTWSTSNAAIGTIDPSSGIVTGITAGSATATYTAPTGCISTSTITVIGSLPSITGTAFNVCPGFTITLSDATGGGNWSSSNTGVAIVGSGSGIVTGIAAGTATITYALGAGCSTTATVTVNGQPITGITTICTGANTTLSDIETGGTWSSTSTNIVVGSSSGIVTGLSAGVANITYLTPAGCTVTTTVSVVNTLPSIITIPPVCVGLTANVYDGVTGGTWSSSNTSVATVGSGSGIVTGVAAGTVIITYTISSGCNTTIILTVNPLSSITGTLNICQGTNVMLIDTTSGGVWTSSNANVTIGSSSGIATGNTPGTATITYALPSGCSTTATVTVNPVAPITGITSICHPGTTTLSNSISGGTWTSSNPGVGTIDPVSGVVTSVAVGTTIITYLLPTGCAATTTVNVVSSLPAITGNTNDCVGLPSTLIDAISGGTWSSSDGTVATVDPISGSVTGVAPGSATITYALGTGCSTTTLVSINALPAAISGTVNVCVGLTGTLADDTTGGNWTSGNTLIATVGSGTGIVTGVSAGTANVTYTTLAGCIATTSVTVNPLPAAITGILNICPALSTTLIDTTTGGSWSSSNTTVGTIDPVTGIVASLTTGYTIITYTLPTSCIATATLNVISVVAPIAGSLTVCTNSTTSLSDIYTGGTWATSNTNASVGSSSGVVSGSVQGTTTVTYTLGSGCTVTAAVTINPAPTAIFGNLQVCLNAVTTINDTTTGGTWSASNTNITIGSATGSVHGNNAGTDTVAYTIPTGCKTTAIFTVNALPVQYNVGGGGAYCFSQPGVPVLLNNSDTGVTYLLYFGTTSTGIDTQGTGAALNFGLVTTAGSYFVMATNNTTHCANGMLDSAVVTITPAVVPSITISSILGDTVCIGTYTTFTASILNGGTTPVYEWFVNGTRPGADSNHYSYVPVNGDVVSVKLTSNAVCALPDTAMDAITMTVSNKQLPAVSISMIPGDTLCAGTLSYFMANATFGGSAPEYSWFKNSTMVGSGSTYSFTPYLPDNGDIIYCKMVSNYFCISTDTVSSSYIHITVDSSRIPFITLDANPGTHIIQWQSDTIVATVTDAGSSPRYQWILNHTLVPNDTTNTFISDSLANNDSVTCIVYGSGECALYSVNSAIITVTPTGVQQVTAGNIDVRLVPNPNNGTFNIKGTLGSTIDEEVSFEITDMLGQVIYRNKVMAVNGKINEQIRLNTTLANGMYTLNLHTEHESKVFHLVIEQ